MYQLYQQPGISLEIGWDVIGPLLLMVVLFAAAVPVWVALGFAAIGLLWTTEVLPLRLFGVALFKGIDAFALIVNTLYIPTGYRLVRSWLLDQLLYIDESTLGSLTC